MDMKHPFKYDFGDAMLPLQNARVSLRTKYDTQAIAYMEIQTYQHPTAIMVLEPKWSIQ